MDNFDKLSEINKITKTVRSIKSYIRSDEINVTKPINSIVSVTGVDYDTVYNLVTNDPNGEKLQQFQDDQILSW
jgi:hypothetical protein